MHVRVTGGMTQESVQKEFESLMAVNSCSNFDNEAIRPFACTLIMSLKNAAFILGLDFLTIIVIKHSI